MTQRLDMVYICSKLFENISMDEKVIVRTRKVQLMSICCHCDLDLEATDKSFACDTSYWYSSYLCQVIWKYLYAWHSYGPDKKSSIKVYFLSLWPWPWIYRFLFCIWHIVLIWCMFVPSYLKISLCMTKLWSGQEKFN